MRHSERVSAGLLFFLGSVEFIFGMLIAEASLPTYSVSADHISDLGVGSTAILFNASVMILGILSLVGVFLFHRIHKRLWITIPFLLAGIGSIGVGVFPETVPAPHLVSALLSFLFGGLAAILTSSQTRPPFRYLAIALGIITIAAIVLFETGQNLGIGTGGMERMIVYPGLLWEAAFGAYLMSTPPADAVASPRPESEV